MLRTNIQQLREIQECAVRESDSTARAYQWSMTVNHKHQWCFRQYESLRSNQ